MRLPRPAPTVWTLDQWPRYNSPDYWGLITKITAEACTNPAGVNPESMEHAKIFIDQYGLRAAPDLMAMALSLLDAEADPRCCNAYGVPLVELCLPKEMQAATSFQAGVILSDNTAPQDPVARTERFQDAQRLASWSQDIMSAWRKLMQAALYTRPASDGGDTAALRRAALQLRRGPGIDGQGIPVTNDNSINSGREEALTGVVLAWAVCRYGVGGGAQYSHDSTTRRRT